MIVSGLVLFLFGTVVSAGPFIAPAPTEIIISKNKHHHDKITEYYPSSNQSPFISNFIQKGTNVFFKPQFVLSAAQMPPQVQGLIAQIDKDDCRTTYPMGPVPVLPIVEEPLRIIEKEVITSPDIKEVIEINPMEISYPVALPKAPMIIEEPCVIEQVVVPEAPLLPSYVSEVPASMVPIVVEVEELKANVNIPPAPVLQPLEMPKIPLMVEEVPFVAPVPEVPVIIEMEQPKEIVMPIIPPAPVLPPMDLPKMPLLIEKPCAPTELIHEVELKPVEMPEIPSVSIIPESYIREVIEEKSVVIPQAPELPPFSPPEFPILIEEKVIAEPMPQTISYDVVEPVRPMVIPEAPVLPPVLVDIPASVVIEEVSPIGFEIEKEIKETVVIPPAPVLPPLNIPKMSVLVEESKLVPCPPGEEIHEITSKPLVIPSAPVLPTVAELIISQPAPVETEESLIVIPQAPELPPFTMPKLPVEVIVKENVMANTVLAPCDTVEIIEEHVQPMVIPEAPFLPPLAPIELPVRMVVEVQKEIVKPVENIEVIEEHIEPMVIPEAPVLPPLAPLEVPTPIIIEEPVSFEVQKQIVSSVILPPAPVLSPLEMPKVVPCETIEIIEEHVQPMMVPEAPVLPPLAPLAIPTPIVVEEPVSVEIRQETVKPVMLPPAPVLPPLEMARVPIMVDRSAEVVVAPCPPEKEIVIGQMPMMPVPFAYSELSLAKPVVLPPAPIASDFYVPYVHQKVADEPVFVEMNSQLSFPKSCVEDIVVERILPKMGKALRTNKASVPIHYFPLGNAVF